MNNKLFNEEFFDSWNIVLDQRQQIEEPLITAYKKFKIIDNLLYFQGFISIIRLSFVTIFKLLITLFSYIILKPYSYVMLLLYMVLRFLGFDICPLLGNTIISFFKQVTFYFM